MIPADDYAKAVFMLQHPSRPPYVSFQTSASAHGIAGDSEPFQTVFVRTKDGAVVEGTLQNFSTGHYESRQNTNPVTRPAFRPQCYVPQSEKKTTWEGSSVLEISLSAVCRDTDGDTSDNPFGRLYVDPVSLTPVGAAGTFDDSGVTVDLEEHFGRFGSFVFPSDVQAHVRGHGLLFWLRERATVTYSNYQFYERLPGNIRRQASAPQ